MMHISPSELPRMSSSSASGRVSSGSNRVTSSDWVEEYGPQFNPDIDFHTVFDKVFEDSMSAQPRRTQTEMEESIFQASPMVASRPPQIARNTSMRRVGSSNRVSTADWIASAVCQAADPPSASARETTVEWIETHVLGDGRNPDKRASGMEIPSLPSTPRNPCKEARPPSPTVVTDGEEEPTPDPQCKREPDVACEPKEVDVLFGRGGRGNHHPGNKRYRDMVKQVQPNYKTCTKVQKTELSLSIVEHVLANGGRFLIQDEKTKTWHEADKKAARRKVSQALREEGRPTVSKRKTKS